MELFRKTPKAKRLSITFETFNILMVEKAAKFQPFPLEFSYFRGLRSAFFNLIVS